MADNKSNKNSPLKPGGSNKSDDNFDWSKVIKLVFGWGAVIVAAVIVMQIFRTNNVSYTEIPYNQYEKLLAEDKILKATITKSDINDYSFKAELRSEEKIIINKKEVPVKEISVYLPEPMIKDQEAIWKMKGINYSFDKESNEWLNIILGFIPWVIIIAVWLFIMRRMQGSTGGTRGIFSFGKSKAKLITQSGTRVTFKDVAGADEAKMELQEIIEFLNVMKKRYKL